MREVPSFHAPSCFVGGYRHHLSAGYSPCNLKTESTTITFDELDLALASLSPGVAQALVNIFTDLLLGHHPAVGIQCINLWSLHQQLLAFEHVHYTFLDKSSKADKGVKVQRWLGLTTGLLATL